MKYASPEELDFVYSLARDVKGSNARIFPLFGSSPSHPDYDGPCILFDEDGFELVNVDSANNQLAMPWKGLYSFTDSFWSLLRLIRHEARQQAIAKKRSAKGAKSPNLRLVTDADTAIALPTTEGKLNRLERAAARKQQAEQKHAERQAKSAKQRGKQV